MKWSKWIRQIHRWLSIIVTLTVIAHVILLMFTGLYMFFLPYVARRRSGLAAGGSPGP